MSFSAAISEIILGGAGSRARAFGTYTNTGGSTGGDILTGLSTVLALTLQPDGSSASTNASVVNETFPVLDNTAVTIVTDADEDGQWEAIGY